MTLGAWIKAQVKQEPIAVFAVLLPIALAVFQSDWLADLFEAEVTIEAHYVELADGRCSLLAFSLDNYTQRLASDVKIHVIEDWMTRTGRETLDISDREGALISRSMETPIEFRGSLNIDYRIEGSTVHVPTLLSGEYIDFFLHRSTNPDLTKARQALSEDPHYRFTPRVGAATSAEGEVGVRHHGACIEALYG